MGTMFAIWGLCMAAIFWMIWNTPERKMVCVPADRIVLRRTGEITRWGGLKMWDGGGNQAGLPLNNFKEAKGDLVHILVWRA